MKQFVILFHMIVEKKTFVLDHLDPFHDLLSNSISPFLNTIFNIPICSFLEYLKVRRSYINIVI